MHRLKILLILWCSALNVPVGAIFSSDVLFWVSVVVPQVERHTEQESIHSHFAQRRSASPYFFVVGL